MNNEFAERLLSKAVEDGVSEALSNVARKMNDLIKKGLPEAKQKDARLYVLEMIEGGCTTFCAKAKERLEKNASK